MMATGIVLLACGGRDFGIPPKDATPEQIRAARMERELLEFVLDEVHATAPLATLVHGAARGADKLADAWARWRGIDRRPHEAEWRKYGKAAGPIRNREMLDEEDPDVVLAFPGGDGTADMIEQAEAYGVQVLRVKRVDDARDLLSSIAA